MFVELNCGRCESYIHLDSEEEDPVWLMAHRFSNAHAECGFMTPSSAEQDTPLKKKVIKPRRHDESEET
jgi:hypothetical protein